MFPSLNLATKVESQEEHLLPGLFPFLSFLSGCSGRYCRLGRLGWDFKSQGKPGEGCDP